MGIPREGLVGVYGEGGGCSMLLLCGWCSIAFSHFCLVCVQAHLRILRSNSHETGEAQPQISRRTEVATSNDHFERQKSFCFQRVITMDWLFGRGGGGGGGGGL